MLLIIESYMANSNIRPIHNIRLEGMSLKLVQIFTMTQGWTDKILEAKAQSHRHCHLTNPIFGHIILHL